MSHPLIDNRTTLVQLQKLGAVTLSDIPVEELLEFVRHHCLAVAKNGVWEEDFAEAAEAAQKAIEAITRVYNE